MKKYSPSSQKFFQNEPAYHSRVIWALPLAIAAIVLGLYIAKFNTGRLSDLKDDWGTFGDYFGGLLNPIIAACTLFVAASVWQLQKKELRATQEALEDQARIAEQQRGEQRFFDLFRIYESTINSINFTGKVDNKEDGLPIMIGGKNAIDYFLNSYDHWIARDINPWISVDSWGSPDYEKINHIWSMPKTADLFDHYFRVVFRLLRESESLLGADHFRYVKIFRSQLSRGELFAIAFHLMTSTEGLRMKEVILKYGLLKHLPSSFLRTHLEATQPPAIFGRKFVEFSESSQQSAEQ